MAHPPQLRQSSVGFLHPQGHPLLIPPRVSTQAQGDPLPFRPQLRDGGPGGKAGGPVTRHGEIKADAQPLNAPGVRGILPRALMHRHRRPQRSRIPLPQESVEVAGLPAH